MLVADANSAEAEARAALLIQLLLNLLCRNDRRSFNIDAAQARADADNDAATLPLTLLNLLQAQEDAMLLGLIESNDGDIALLQTGVNDNTMDIADLMSVISIDENGITVNDLTISGDLNFPGVFSAATGLFNYLSANNADFEDMIAEAAQVEQLIFFEGRALGDQSSLDVDGTFNVDGQSTMGGDLTVAGTISSQGSLLATEAYTMLEMLLSKLLSLLKLMPTRPNQPQALMPTLLWMRPLLLMLPLMLLNLLLVLLPTLLDCCHCL